MIKTGKGIVFRYVKLTNQLSYEIKIPTSGPTYRGKWLIHDAKHYKSNQLKSLALSCRQYKFDINESDGNMFNPQFLRGVHQQKHIGRRGIAEVISASCTKPKSKTQIG